MKEIIKLTNRENQIVLIGTKHIIQVKDLRNNANVKDYQSEVNSLGAMMTTNHVKESIEEIHALIYPNTNKEEININQYEFFIFSSMVLQVDDAIAELDYNYQYATIRTMYAEYKERNLENIHVLESITNYIHLYYEDEN